MQPLVRPDVKAFSPTASPHPPIPFQMLVRILAATSRFPAWTVHQSAIIEHAAVPDDKAYGIAPPVNYAHRVEPIHDGATGMSPIRALAAAASSADRLAANRARKGMS